MFANSQQIKFYVCGHTMNSIFIPNAFILVGSRNLALYLTRFPYVLKIRLEVYGWDEHKEMQITAKCFLFIYSLSGYAPIFVSNHEFLYISIHISIYLPTYLSTYLSICLLIYLPLSLSIHLPAYLVTYLPTYISIQLSLYSFSVYKLPVPKKSHL